MPSERQIAANRKNAKKSTGPRSKAGREASCRNARRHGLAIAIETDPAFHADIEKLAKVLSPSDGTKNVDERAREAAGAELDLFSKNPGFPVRNTLRHLEQPSRGKRQARQA